MQRIKPQLVSNLKKPRAQLPCIVCGELMPSTEGLVCRECGRKGR